MERTQHHGDGRVTQWDEAAGWGVITIDGSDLAVWTHYSAIASPPGAFRSLSPGQHVHCWYEIPGQDGYPARATNVESPDR